MVVSPDFSSPLPPRIRLKGRFTRPQAGESPDVGRTGDKTDSQLNHWAQTDENVRLMLAFQKGRQEAFRELVERNQAKVYAVVCRLVGDPMQAEDLTQEVFLRVFRTVKRYQPMAKFSTWLYRIASNVALSFTAGISLGFADAGGSEITGQQIGIGGIHYYFN